MSTRPSTALAQPSTIRDAGSPFDDIVPGHSVVLRSSDNVDFFVYKAYLHKASTFFAGMFDLHDEHSPVLDDDESREGIPIIRMQENAHTLDLFLRLCYPTDNPDLSELPDVRLLLEVCNKYVIEAFDGTLRAALTRLADTRPLAVYALACRYRLEDVANDAAKRFLGIPLRAHSEVDLQDLTAVQYQRVLQYHRNCSLKATTDPPATWFNALVVTLGAAPTTSHSCRAQFHFFYAATQPSKNLWVPHWWTLYLHKALEAVKDRPRGSTVVAPEILEPFRKVIMQCADCMREAEAALQRLSSCLAQEVEKAVSQVPKPYCPP
ncbi:hypothetical protein BV25DRAFT_1921331 [Artomyces pyxidatus]|uniref:Uncharacterized protein n=1 Tax=Artomyces pyxidatus TaxID=48021 RepID=A0ACB8SIA4_9AGAM|nr:hypothetical protein BV25DRAFT_1921331 [Artomyces pyxidatus]